MIDLSNFKPDLIPNRKKTDSEEVIYKAIERNGGYDKYMITFKKDGCRVQIADSLKTRTLKPLASESAIERFSELIEIAKECNLALDSEFYSHEMRFNEVVRFFKNTDVSRSKVRNALEKLKSKDPSGYVRDFGDRSIEWLTTFHEDLKLWVFDGLVLDRPDLTRFEDRINIIIERLLPFTKTNPIFTLPKFYKVKSREELEALYRHALEEGWEGLVLTHIDHQYKYGRNSLNKGTILKLKDDKQEFDGVVLDVEEGTIIKDGVERTRDELGNSRTSKCKDDRRPSGMAKGFVVEYQDKGTFTVSLRGYSHEQRRDILKNKVDYIGRHFRYTGMPPTKDFPRSAYFDSWRDDK